MPLPANEFIAIDNACREMYSIVIVMKKKRRSIVFLIDINIILRFINRLNNDVKVDGSFIQRLCRFKKDVVNNSIQCKKQATLDRYLV